MDIDTEVAIQNKWIEKYTNLLKEGESERTEYYNDCIEHHKKEIEELEAQRKYRTIDEFERRLVKVRTELRKRNNELKVIKKNLSFPITTPCDEETFLREIICKLIDDKNKEIKSAEDDIELISNILVKYDVITCNTVVETAKKLKHFEFAIPTHVHFAIIWYTLLLTIETEKNIDKAKAEIKYEDYKFYKNGVVIDNAEVEKEYGCSIFYRSPEDKYLSFHVAVPMHGECMLDFHQCVGRFKRIDYNVYFN